MSVPTASTTIGATQGSITELVLVTGAEQRQVALHHVPFTIGRRPDRDMVITDARVSRDHAEIRADGADFVLVDVGSSSGTFVNGEKVQRYKLKYNDRVEFGAKGGPYFIFNPTSADRLEVLKGLSSIARVSIFSKLNQADIEELTKITSTKKYGADATVFFQGDPSDSLYMLLTGSVKVTQASEGGREKILDILGPGEIFGEFAMLDGHPRSAAVTTCEPSELASITHKDFRNFVASRPEILWKVLEGLCERVRKTSTEIVDVTSREVPYRLLAALHHMAEKYGQVAADGSCLISGKVGMQDLVAMVGSSREVVSRLLHRYQEKGLVELGSNKEIIIPDPAALSKALEYSSEW